MRFILTLLIWVATFVVLAYLLLSGFLLISFQGQGDQEAVKNVLADNKEVVVSFFGFLGAIVALLQHWLGNGSDLETADDEVVDGQAVERLKDQYRKLYNKALRLRERTIKEMANRFAIKVAVFFSFCHLATAGLQGLIRRAYPIENYPEESAEYRVLEFLQSELMIAAAILVPIYFYRGYLKQVRNSSKGRTYGKALQIGGFSLLLVGAISILTLSPEQFAAMIREGGMNTRVFDINYLAYAALLRLLVLPIIGFLSCAVYLQFSGKSKRRVN